jgi:IS30 family transposase
MHDQLRQLVAARLEDNWSPEQTAGWLKHTYPDGVLKELQAHLRSGRTIRRSPHATSKSDQRGSFVDAVS